MQYITLDSIILHTAIKMLKLSENLNTRIVYTKALSYIGIILDIIPLIKISICSEIKLRHLISKIQSYFTTTLN